MVVKNRCKNKNYISLLFFSSPEQSAKAVTTQPVPLTISTQSLTTPSREEVHDTMLKKGKGKRKSNETVAALRSIVEDSDNRNEIFFEKLMLKQQESDDAQKNRDRELLIELAKIMKK